MNYLIVYDKTTFQIADYVGSSSVPPPETSVNCNPVTQGLVRAQNPKCTISCNHKVVLDNGDLIDTEYSVNPTQPIPSPYPAALFANKTQVTADSIDVATVTVLGDATAVVTLDVFFAWSEDDAVGAEVMLDTSGRGELVVGPFGVGTVGQIIVCSQERTTTPYPRVEVEVVDA